MTDEQYPLTRAILLQLNAELVAHEVTIREVAKRMGKDYNTFRRYMTGEREMPVTVLTSALAAIDLDPVTFIARAQERARSAAR